jgi:spore germination protein KC
MTARKKYSALLLLTAVLAALLSGCWDNHELDTLFIVTGVALDAAGDSDQTDITLQVSKTQPKSGDSGQPGPQDDAMLLLKSTRHTLLEAMMAFNRSSSRTLLLQHNQVLVMGARLAEQGVWNHMDVFLRERSTRMEVLMIIAENRAEEVVSAKLGQEKLSGIYLSRMVQNLSNVSPYYKVRMLDFASRLLDKSTAPVAPLISVVEEDGGQEIRMLGMAVFKGDRMIGRLSNDETSGYVWAMGPVEQCEVVAGTDAGRAVFQIMRMDCDREAELREDGGVRVTLRVNAVLNVGELQGFEGIKTDELLPYLSGLAQDGIRSRIMDTFEIARGLNADIYEFGALIHGKYPREWKSMKAEWDAIFPEIVFDVQVNARISATGQIINSLGMEAEKGEN